MLRSKHVLSFKVLWALQLCFLLDKSHWEEEVEDCFFYYSKKKKEKEKKNKF